MIDLGIDEIVGTSFPPQQITLVSAGSVTRALFRPAEILDCTCAAYLLGNCDDDLPWPSYWYRFETGMDAPIVHRNSMDWIIKGQTSGFESYVGIQERFDLGIPENVCAININPTTYVEANVGQKLLVIDVYDKTSRGYINFETVDLTFTLPPATPIQNINFRSADSIYVNSADHNMVNFSWIRISGTTLYEGVWRIDGVTDSGQFWIEDPGIWAGTAQGGQFDPIFDI